MNRTVILVLAASALLAGCGKPSLREQERLAAVEAAREAAHNTSVVTTERETTVDGAGKMRVETQTESVGVVKADLVATAGECKVYRAYVLTPGGDFSHSVFVAEGNGTSGGMTNCSLSVR